MSRGGRGLGRNRTWSGGGRAPAKYICPKVNLGQHLLRPFNLLAGATLCLRPGRSSPAPPGAGTREAQLEGRSRPPDNDYYQAGGSTAP